MAMVFLRSKCYLLFQFSSSMISDYVLQYPKTISYDTIAWELCWFQIHLINNTMSGCVINPIFSVHSVWWRVHVLMMITLEHFDVQTCEMLHVHVLAKMCMEHSHLILLYFNTINFLDISFSLLIQFWICWNKIKYCCCFLKQICTILTL